MKKLLSFILIAIMLLPAAAHTTSAAPTKIITATLAFQTPEVRTADGTSTVSIGNANSWLHAPGAPTLPSQLLSYTFPLGTTINSITVTSAPTQEIPLTTDLSLAASPQTAVDDATITAPTQAVNLASYPAQTWTYSLGGGISSQGHTLFLNIRYTPLQYHQTAHTLSYSSSATVTIDYTLPTSTPFPLTSTYDLVIIAPQKFTTALQPLVGLKTAHGVTTKLVAMETICNNTNYSAGRDCAEKMKLFIKDAIEHWGTSYVLLVGGRYGGIMKEKWWLPVRYSHLDDGSEGSYLSDLYFSDIYTANGSFSSWDTNGNGIFGEWTTTAKDVLDMYPDVYLGRLPCTSAAEVTRVVNKIVTYENTTADPSWFKKMVVVGGDSAPGDQWYEGEVENQLAISYMTGFSPIRLWTSNGNLSGRADVIGTVNSGCGFLYFDGHGNPMVWATHPPNNNSWVNGLINPDMFKFSNREKLPVVVCGGCHNAEFNISLNNIIKGIIQFGFTSYFHSKFWWREWAPECWAWRFVTAPRGGGIASMAYTGLDWFATGDYNNDSIADCTQFYSGFMDTRFFDSYGVNNLTVLGQAHTHALIAYMNAFPPMADQYDCKTVQEFTLLGDPTLVIGGYQ